MSSATSSKKIVINTLVYSVSGIMLKCFSFFLLPLYTTFLTTEDYGLTSIANSFVNTMVFIVAFSLFSAVMRFYVDLKNDIEKLKRFYGTISLFTMISGVAWAFVFYILRVQVSRYIFSGVDFYPVILICLIELVFTCQMTIFDDILKSQQKAMASSILTIISFFLRLGLNILFVVVLKMGATGTLLASAIVSTIYTVAFSIYLLSKKLMVYCLDIPLLKEALKYSIPIMPHNLATKIALLVSKVLIGGVDSLAGLGVYSVATQFGDIADTLQNYVDKAYQPWLYERLNARETDFESSIRSIVKVLIGILGLLFLGIALFAQDYIFLFINKSYIDAWKYIPLIVCVYSIKTIYYFYIEVLFYHKEASKRIFIATITSSLVNVLFSAALIPKYLVFGSIMADAIAMFVRVAIVVRMSKNYEDIGLKVFDFVINFVVIIVFITIGLLPSLFFSVTSFSIINFTYKILVTAVYIIVFMLRNRTQLKPAMVMVESKFRNRRL